MTAPKAQYAAGSPYGSGRPCSVRPPSACTRAANSRVNRVLPIPGGPTSVTSCGWSSPEVRAHALASSSSSASRPMNGAAESGRSAGADVTVRASHTAQRLPACPSARIGSIASHAIACAQAMWVCSPSSTPCGGAPACSRAAVLTASPITVNSRRPSGPTGAKMTSPVLTPTRTCSPPKSAASSDGAALDLERRPHRPLGVVLVSDRRPEHRHQRVADDLVHGASEPLHHLRPSRPCSRPPCERISSGSVRSESAVNPDRSANTTVTQRRSPPRRRRARRALPDGPSGNPWCRTPRRILRRSESRVDCPDRRPRISGERRPAVAAEALRGLVDLSVGAGAVPATANIT